MSVHAVLTQCWLLHAALQSRTSPCLMLLCKQGCVVLQALQGHGRQGVHHMQALLLKQHQWHQGQLLHQQQRELQTSPPLQAPPLLSSLRAPLQQLAVVLLHNSRQPPTQACLCQLLLERQLCHQQVSC